MPNNDHGPDRFLALFLIWVMLFVLAQCTAKKAGAEGPTHVYYLPIVAKGESRLTALLDPCLWGQETIADFPPGMLACYNVTITNHTDARIQFCVAGITIERDTGEIFQRQREVGDSRYIEPGCTLEFTDIFFLMSPHTYTISASLCAAGSAICRSGQLWENLPESVVVPVYVGPEQ